MLKNEGKAEKVERIKPKSKKKMNRGVKMFLTYFTCLVVLSLIVYAIGIYTNFLEIKEIGENFTQIFWTNFNINILVQIIAFVITFVFVLINSSILRNNLIDLDTEFLYIKKWIVVFVSLVMSFFISLAFSHTIAEKFLMFANSEWFGVGDPIFHQDVGYYVFQRPFMIEVTNAVITLMLVLAAFNVIIYSILYTRRENMTIKNLLREKSVTIHVLINIALYLIAKATSYRFTMENTLFQQGNNWVGPSFTDAHVWLGFYKFAPYLLGIIAIVVIFMLFKNKILPAIGVIMLYPLSLIIMFMASFVIQAFYVLPNEAVLEEPYISNNIQMTRLAYGLNNVKTEQFDINYSLSAKDISENSSLINNIRITDYQQNLNALNQIQGLKNYYTFVNSDISTYKLNGVKTAVSVAARELDTSKLADSAKNYINIHMKYTHGMGVVMNPVNSITSEGQPMTVIKDLTSRSIDGAPFVNEPRIYYGESMDDYVFVNTKDGEYDEENQGGNYEYNGDAGIPLTFSNKILFAARNADINILISSQLQQQSKMLINTNVIKRAKKAIPFLQIDTNPQIVIDDNGNLQWVINAYTTSTNFPYAEYSDGVNYIRNSAKIVVDAYDGSTKVYVVDKTDPIIKAYQKMYPKAFEQGDFPADLAEHMKYPESLFKTQAAMLAKYHETNPTEFYQRNNVWAFAREKYDNDKAKDIDPYYAMVQLDATRGEELVAMVPFTLANKENLVSWLAIRSEANGYGEMVCYEFPQDENVYGTYQIESKIDTDPTISQSITLWNQSGSSVVRGNLLVIPIKNSLLYVEPIYMIASGDIAMPSIKGVVVCYGDKVVMETTLVGAINKLFNINTQPDQGTTDTSVEDIKSVIEKTIKSFGEYKGYLQSGDWENSGKAMKVLDEDVRTLESYNGEI
ncbi:MAG: UPF0182 family protein [Clostridiales bacterium]|jgi:uncharacterized membrane protein (UPF0182 family)|nr:UPF0182 family protein [Clostridiales bacterium]